jgi:hypothetical protein
MVSKGSKRIRERGRRIGERVSRGEKTGKEGMRTKQKGKGKE